MNYFKFKFTVEQYINGNLFGNVLKIGKCIIWNHNTGIMTKIQSLLIDKYMFLSNPSVKNNKKGKSCSTFL